MIEIFKNAWGADPGNVYGCTGSVGSSGDCDGQWVNGRGEVDEQTSVLHMHSADAEPREIETGDSVRVFNGRGSCLMKAEVGDGVIPGIVRAPSVRWNKRFAGGRGINVLTSDRLTDIGGGPTFYNCLVQVEKCGD